MNICEKCGQGTASHTGKSMLCWRCEAKENDIKLQLPMDDQSSQKANGVVKTTIKFGVPLEEGYPYSTG